VNSVGLIAPVSALVVFGLIYLPAVKYFSPSSSWIRMPFSPQIFFLLASIVILRFKRIGWREIGLSGEKLGRRIGLGFWIGLSPVVVTLLLVFLMTWVDSIWPFLRKPLWGGGPLRSTLATSDLVTLIVLAPICEELFFRGILLRGLRESYPAWIAVAGSALIFMGGHGWLAIGPLVLGIVNGIVVLRTGSLLPGIVFHAIANAYGPVMIRWFPNLYDYLSFFYR
jgi:uncharacterized protein